MIITLKDNSTLDLESGVSVMDVAKTISAGLARVALCARVNGEIVGMDEILNDDCSLEILTFNDEEGKARFEVSMLFRDGNKEN